MCFTCRQSFLEAGYSHFSHSTRGKQCTALSTTRLAAISLNNFLRLHISILLFKFNCIAAPRTHHAIYPIVSFHKGNWRANELLRVKMLMILVNLFIQRNSEMRVRLFRIYSNDRMHAAFAALDAS